MSSVCRDVLHEYALKCKRIKGDILGAMAKILKLDEDCLVNQFNSNAPTFARFNHFPPCPRPDLVLGLKPHADFPALTVLLMDKDVAGLQYLRDGTWYNVPAACDHTLLINIGLTMEVTISESLVNFLPYTQVLDEFRLTIPHADNDQRDLHGANA